VFDRVIIVDWSAATQRSLRPRADRCWLAWGDRGMPCSLRPAPEYFPTRIDCTARIAELAAGCGGRVLVGLDFPFAYPEAARLPAGRELCAELSRLVEDLPDGSNNRFEVACTLNRRLASSGVVSPFWGHPPGRSYADLHPTRPTTSVPEYRLVERLLRARGLAIQSAFKLWGSGSAGSQTLTGLAAIGRLLDDPRLRSRAVLWPWETLWDARVEAEAVVFAEVWPSLAPHQHVQYAHLPIKDARQTAAQRDTLMLDPHPLAAPADLLDAEGIGRLSAAGSGEGWIVGARAALASLADAGGGGTC
jgi:hypothetical protein